MVWAGGPAQGRRNARVNAGPAIQAGILALAGVLALVGRARLAKARSAGPTAALDSIRADVHEFRHAVADRGRDVAGPDLAKRGVPGSDRGWV